MLTLSPPVPLTAARPAPRSQGNSAIVSVSDLTKSYAVRRRLRETLRHPRTRAQSTALDCFTADVRQGEFFGLLGPNGAGKSTLFRMLATLVVPDGGCATIGGFDLVRDAAKVRRLVGLVSSEERSLNWRLSARENLRFYASLHRMHGRALAERVEEVLNVVDLGATGERMVGEFSSGMRQRLLIARTLLPAPRVLLLDEPTRSLDPVAARRFRQFLRQELVDRQGCTVMLATHSTDEAMGLCDRVAVLQRGQMLAIGTVGELTRRFLGDRYQVWSTVPATDAFDELAAKGMLVDILRKPDVDGHSVIEFASALAGDRSVEILAALVRSGLPVSQFVKVQPALADVIETIVVRGGRLS